jgi:hypothetical protein
VDGVRKQFWFHSEKEAKQAAKDRNDELIAHGSQVALSPLNRMRSINAAERLAPYQKTIDDAVEFYLKYLKQHSASVPFSALSPGERKSVWELVQALRRSTPQSRNRMMPDLWAARQAQMVREIGMER